MHRAEFVEIGSASEAEVGAHAIRGARFPDFVGMPADGDQRLDELKVAIIGVGSVGRALVAHLTRLTPAALWIVDPGRFKNTSYLTHPHLLSGGELGESKALSAARLAKQLSPRTRVCVHDGGVESLPGTAFANADFVFLATDHLAAEVETAQRCMHLGRRLIQASVHGPTLVVQIRCLSNCCEDEPGPCLACGYSPQEWTLLNRQVRFSCEGASDIRSNTEITTAPTMSASFLCSMAADLAMMHMIKWTLGLGPGPDNTMLEYAGYTHRITATPLRRNPTCPCDHVNFVRSSSPQSALSDCTPAELASAGEFDCDRDELSYTLKLTDSTRPGVFPSGE